MLGVMLRVILGVGVWLALGHCGFVGKRVSQRTV
jgi:hypothetical protein